jgi:hypothetical protein
MNKKRIRESILTLCAATVLVSDFIGVSTMDSVKLHEMEFLRGIILLLATIVFTYLLYELLTKKENWKLKLVAHLFEGLAQLFASYILFMEHLKLLPYATLAGSIATFVVTIVRFRKERNIKEII